MDLASQIYIRKSCRKYSDEKIDMDTIHDFLLKVKPLDESINYYYKIFKKDDVKIRTRWSAPYYLALFSEQRTLSGENIGFVFQQVSLFMQSIGIGSCWVGLGTVKESNPEFVILIAFGKSDDMTRDISGFKRRELSEICDVGDERLIPAQLAPSAINSQPWYFKHTDDGFDVYMKRQNIIKRQFIKKWNPIDVGIALAHLYVSNEKTFVFEVKSSYEKLNGYEYTGSIKI